MSERYVHKSGEWLRFDKGDDTKPGHGGRDHWHHSSDPKRHLYPGDDVPDPPAMCEVFVRPMPEVDDMFDDDAPQPGDTFFPLLPLFFPASLPEWFPFFIPAWAP